MKKYFFILLGLLAQNLVLAQKDFSNRAYIDAQAKADSLVTPDRIFLSIYINEEDSKNKKSVEQQEREMERRLKSLGIDIQKDLTISGLNSSFWKRQNIVKSKQYELLVKDAVTAGKVLFSLEEAGISNVNISKLEYSKKEELLLELKSKAAEKTKKSAEKMVKPLNQKVGKAFYISDSSDNYYYDNDEYESVQYKRVATMANVVPEPVLVEIRKIKFEAKVYVKYILE